MPEISRFFGIFITLNFNDHNPPHFHERYGDFNGLFEIETGNLIEGNLPKTAKKLVKTWAALHRLVSCQVSSDVSMSYRTMESLY